MDMSNLSRAVFHSSSSSSFVQATTTTSSPTTISSPLPLPTTSPPTTNWSHQNDDCDTLKPEQLYVNLSTFWYCFLALITAIGLMVSLVSNMIIVYLFTSTPSLRQNPSNIVAVNLSLSDLLYCIQWPSVIYCCLSHSSWILESEFVCQTFGFITLTTALASILTVLVMSVERAIVIIYSVHAKSRFTNRTAWLIIVLIWIVSLSTGLPPLFGRYNRYTLDPSKTSCTLDYLSHNTHYKVYVLALYVAYWIVPTIIISICYYLIVATFKRSSVSLREISGGSGVSGCGGSSSSDVTSSCGRSIQLCRSTASRPFMAAIRRGTRSKVAAVDHRCSSYSSPSSSVRRLTTTSKSSIMLAQVTSSSFLSSSSSSASSFAATTTNNNNNNNNNNTNTKPKVATISRAARLNDSIRLQHRLSSAPSSLQGRSSMAMVASTTTTTTMNKTVDLDRGQAEPPQAASTNTTQQQQQQRIDPASRWRASFKRVASCSHLLKSILPMTATTTTTTTDIDHDDSCYQLQRTNSLSEHWSHQHQHHHSLGPGRMTSARQQSASTKSDKNFTNYRQVIQFRLARMSFYLILLWLVSWTPIASLAMVNVVKRCHRASATAVFIANTMTKLGPALDVFIYGVSHPKIKSKFKEISQIVVHFK